MVLGSRWSNLRALGLVLVTTAMGVGCGFAGGGGLRPFADDGCSMFFDGTPAQRDLWRHCCYTHDTAYWRGGTREERKAADRQLRSCVDQAQDAALAELMYLGVRTGGGPCWPTSYRWGYGWPYGRGYRPLTEDERELADRILAQAEAALAEKAKAKRATAEPP